MAAQFLRDKGQTADLIAWHGHTIFHDPEQQATCQIGDGAAIAAKTGLPVTYKFRHMDMALGGQGAPLAPLADRWLLPSASFYLNLGGISNLAFFDQDQQLRSYDVSPCNQILNRLAMSLGLEYDENGKIAAAGKLNSQLFDELSQVSYYKQPYPKSMDNNWVQKVFWPHVEQSTISTQDKICTMTHHIAAMIAEDIKNAPVAIKSLATIIPTGGGAYNDFLLQQLRQYLKGSGRDYKIEKPSADWIEFKEAALMALMGFLLVNGMTNVYSSVTGSSHDHIGGCYIPSPTNPASLQ